MRFTRSFRFVILCTAIAQWVTCGGSRRTSERGRADPGAGGRGFIGYLKSNNLLASGHTAHMSAIVEDLLLATDPASLAERAGFQSLGLNRVEEAT
jgi:hypothetical protein